MSQNPPGKPPKERAGGKIEEAGEYGETAGEEGEEMAERTNGQGAGAGGLGNKATDKVTASKGPIAQNSQSNGGGVDVDRTCAMTEETSDDLMKVVETDNGRQTTSKKPCEANDMARETRPQPPECVIARGEAGRSVSDR